MDFTNTLIKYRATIVIQTYSAHYLQRKRALNLLVSILLGRYRNYDVFLKFKCDHVTHANRHLCVCYKH